MEVWAPRRTVDMSADTGHTLAQLSSRGRNLGIKGRTRSLKEPLIKGGRANNDNYTRRQSTY